jgi:hypothetical protein
MPNATPTPEMVEFARPLGGVVIRDADLPFGRVVGADPALAFAAQLLEDFEGVRNEEGCAFRSELQMFDTAAPVAIGGFAKGRFCLGVTAGYTARLAEISAAVVHILCLGVDSAVRSIPDLGSIGSQFMGGDSSARARRAGGFEGLIRPLFEAATS